MSTAKERVLALMKDREWYPGHVIASPEVGGSEGLRRLRELRADGYDIERRRTPNGTTNDYRLIDRAASPTWRELGEGEKPVGEPAIPIPAGTIGQAMAITAWAKHCLTGKQHRLLWCVDLKRDVGPDAESPNNPTDPSEYPTTQWGELLNRFRYALDNQPWNGFRAHIALLVRYTDQHTGQQMALAFSLPYSANLVRMAKAPPPVGVWRIMPCPSPLVSNRGIHTLDFAGDNKPASFWFDGIPF